MFAYLVAQDTNFWTDQIFLKSIVQVKIEINTKLLLLDRRFC